MDEGSNWPDASVAVPFDRTYYDFLAPDEQHEFFLGMLREGIDKCHRHHKIPCAEILAAMDEFRRSGDKNEWIDKTKLFRPDGARASLLCSPDTNRLLLTLHLEK